jgi:hypothetical protein
MPQADDEHVKSELDRIHHAVKRWHFPLEDRSKFASWSLCDPARPAVLARAESDLGFELPPLLRAIYTRVGNGGMMLGLMGLPGGMRGDYRFEGLDIVAAYRGLVGVSPTPGEDVWPRYRVPIWTSPTGVRSAPPRYLVCVDCSTRGGEVWREGASGWVRTHSALVEYLEEVIEDYFPL